MDTTRTRPDALKYVAGPLFLVCAALTYNSVMHRLRRPTISEGVRWVINQKMGAEIAGGIIGGLLAHWLLTDGGKNSG